MNQEMRPALLEHYDRERRDLPWRGETDPYRILVSEVMLQQTRVGTVLSYYGRWLERFPDAETLADADESEVLKAWEGLGYYRRARNLHGAAQVVRERYAGVLPGTYEGLRALPGVGEYTAGAVASIAFGEVVPAVDGNVRRVLARLFDEVDPKAKWLRSRAAPLVDPDRPGDWNQALMELGATVCLPRSPKCGECPLSAWCDAFEAGSQEDRPIPVKKAAVRSARFVLGVFETDGRVLLVRRPAEGLLGGMWAFPEQEVVVDGTPSVTTLAQRLGLSMLAAATRLPSIEHSFTHLRATYEPWVVSVAPADARDGRAWVEPTSPGDLALPVAQRRVLESFATRSTVETA